MNLRIITLVIAVAHSNASCVWFQCSDDVSLFDYKFNPEKPTGAPPPQSKCRDDSSWRWASGSTKTCDHVAKDPGSRCDRIGKDGVLARDACFVACNRCVCDYTVRALPYDSDECPKNNNDGSFPKCHEVDCDELCDADKGDPSEKCGTDHELANCPAKAGGRLDIYRKVCAGSGGFYTVKALPYDSDECPTKNNNFRFPKCHVVGCDELCEADEGDPSEFCDTDFRLDNCPASDGGRLDIYRKVCSGIGDSSSPIPEKSIFCTSGSCPSGMEGLIDWDGDVNDCNTYFSDKPVDGLEQSGILARRWVPSFIFY